MILTAIDFKNHVRKAVTLEGVTAIQGKNGAGKTAILEALIFALYGKDFYGNIAVDHYVRSGTISATVILEKEGFNIKRSAGPSENSVYVNGVKSKVSEAVAAVPPMDIAMPIINPLYFLYEMTDIQKRELFMKIMPQKSRVDVFAEKFSKNEDMIERFKISDIDMVKKQRRNLESTLTANNASISNYQAQLVSLSARIEEEEGKNERAPRGVLEKEKEKQKEINEIEARLSVMGNVPVAMQEAKLALEDLANKVKPTLEKYGVKKLSELVDYFSTKVTENEKEIRESNALITETSVQLSQYKKFESGKCPVCGSDVLEAAEKVLELSEKLEHLRDRHVKLEASRGSLVKAFTEASSISSKAEEYRGVIRSCELKSKEYERLNEKRDLLKSQLVGLSEEDFKKAVEIEAQREIIRKMKLEYKDTEREIEKAQESSKQVALELENVEMLVRALSPQGVDAELAVDTAERLEKDVSEIVGQDVSIVTVRRNKTNENVKEVFDVKVGKVNFRSMSFGERIKLAVAFGLAARKYVANFTLDFIVLDEASVLSKGTKDVIVDMLTKNGVGFFYTEATSDEELVIESNLSK